MRQVWDHLPLFFFVLLPILVVLLLLNDVIRKKDMSAFYSIGVALAGDAFIYWQYGDRIKTQYDDFRLRLRNLFQGGAMEHQYQSLNNDLGMLFGIAIIATIAFFIYKARTKGQGPIYQGMPEKGPMKVTLEIEQLSPARHRLHIDIKMTKRDWDAAVAAGYGAVATLFTYDTPNTKDMPYMLGDNWKKKYVDFDDGTKAHAAKEEAIRNLHYLRDIIEQQHEFAARPRDRKETLEI